MYKPTPWEHGQFLPSPYVCIAEHLRDNPGMFLTPDGIPVYPCGHCSHKDGRHPTCRHCNGTGYLVQDTERFVPNPDNPYEWIREDGPAAFRLTPEERREVVRRFFSSLGGE